jgi:VanZ family protein
MALLAVFVAYKALSVVPAGPSFSWDKLNHVGAFAALAFAGLFTFRAKTRPVFWVSFLLLAFGVAIEIAQLYVPGRYAELEDVLADAIGIGLGLLIADQLARRTDRRQRRRDSR